MKHFPASLLLQFRSSSDCHLWRKMLFSRTHPTEAEEKGEHLLFPFLFLREAKMVLIEGNGFFLSRKKGKPRWSVERRRKRNLRHLAVAQITFPHFEKKKKKKINFFPLSRSLRENCCTEPTVLFSFFSKKIPSSLLRALFRKNFFT